MIVADQLASPSGVFLRYQYGDLWIAESRIFQIANAIFEGELFSRDLVMNPVRRGLMVPSCIGQASAILSISKTIKPWDTGGCS